MTDSSRTTSARTIEETLGYSFRDKALLDQALTHASARGTTTIVPNERLAFLGDAVVDLAAAHWLFERNDQSAKGDLTEERKSVVSNEALSALARRHGLAAALRLGRGEETAGRDTESILAGLVEALVGAVFLDGGYEAARDAVHSLMRNEK